MLGDNGCFCDDLEEKPQFYVEVQLKQNSTISRSVLEDRLRHFISEKNISNGFNQLAHDIKQIPDIREDIQNIYITSDLEDNDAQQKLSPNKIELHGRILENTKFQYCIYQLNYDEPGLESLENNSDLTAATHWLLPSASFQGMWENLIYDCNIKTNLLNFASTALLFSDNNVDSKIITWNRVVLLHGPPGTGKTSLCKALAQKLSIRFNNRYSYGQLIEINSHSLFSRWFSESGKLVMKMFEKIQEFVDDPKSLVFVLLDEIESLAHARKSIASGNEPSDAIRVVNAILTQLDIIQKYPNVLILTTSNITGAIDLAFVDRADIKQYIGLPSVKAIFKIYESCIVELTRTGILKPENSSFHPSILHEIAEKSHGLSGRALRKLPFLAHALFLQKKVSSVSEFLNALSLAVTKQFEDIENLRADK